MGLMASLLLLLLLICVIDGLSTVTGATHVVFNATRLNAKAACVKLDDCSCKMEDTGKIVSLQDIDQLSGPRFPSIQDYSSSSRTYSYNPCSSFSEGNLGKDSNCVNVVACRHDILAGGIEYNAVAKPGSMVPQFDKDNNEYAFIYQGNDISGNTQITKILLDCDETQGTPLFKLGFVFSPPNYYTGVLTSKCACAGKCNYVDRRNTKPKASGLSTGSILCIVLFVIVFVYFVSGILINKYARQMEGKELVPNVTFWTDLPVLVKDGIVFIVQNLRRKGSNQYEAIK